MKTKIQENSFPQLLSPLKYLLTVLRIIYTINPVCPCILIFRTFASLLIKSVNDDYKMKNTKIFPKDWLQLHPYKQSGPTDLYYTRIANQIHEMFLNSPLTVVEIDHHIPPKIMHLFDHHYELHNQQLERIF